MKNSDMKVIAIILAIALCLTVLTSNVVSVASVVILAKGNTVAAGAGTNTDVPAGNDGSSSAPTQAPAGNNTATTAAPAGDNTATTAAPSGNTGATQAPAGDNTATTAAPAANSKIDAEALAMFQKAAADINSTGAAGYTKKSWQSIDAFTLDGAESLSGALKGLIEGFMTKEADAEDKVSEKGSEDAMRRMPASNCSQDKIESVTKKEANGNYIITIVMKDENNLKKADTDGLNVMSRDILYMEDVEDTVKNDDTVKKLVKSLDEGTITYKAYTITAEMTKDGKFVNITHKCSADLVAKVSVAIFGQIGGSGTLTFNVVYKDFVY